MKQITVISGKGGTGKSTVVSSLAMIVENKIISDCDVDAPNLHILLNGEIIKESNYSGAKIAIIDKVKCTNCGICQDTCKFNAIDNDNNIIAMKCEGCGACRYTCLVDAIRLESINTGKTYISDTRVGKFSHALLDIGAEGSGKLVTEVRKNTASVLKDEDWIIIDGSPGIGCSVIASISGTDAVMVVSEPTQSGLSDMKRVLAVAKHFNIPGFVCINKYDLNKDITKEIETFCKNNNFPIVGHIAYDETIVTALQNMKTPVEYGNSSFTENIKEIWENIKKEIINLD